MLAMFVREHAEMPSQHLASMQNPEKPILRIVDYLFGIVVLAIAVFLIILLASKWGVIGHRPLLQKLSYLGVAVIALGGVCGALFWLYSRSRKQRSKGQERHVDNGS